MAATRRRFVFKCTQGHVTYKIFSLEARFEDHDETTCQDCLDYGEVKTAYLVWVDFGPTKEKDHA